MSTTLVQIVETAESLPIRGTMTARCNLRLPLTVAHALRADNVSRMYQAAFGERGVNVSQLPPTIRRVKRLMDLSIQPCQPPMRSARRTSNRPMIAAKTTCNCAQATIALSSERSMMHDNTSAQIWTCTVQAFVCCTRQQHSCKGPQALGSNAS